MTLHPAIAAPTEEDPRLILHLLDYLNKDYSGAVDDKGQISSPSEFNEQVEFAQKIADMLQNPKLKARFAELEVDVKELQSRIQTHQAPRLVLPLTQSLLKRARPLSGVELFPSQWPDLSNGRKLFEQNCMSCHNSTTPSAASINSKATTPTTGPATPTTTGPATPPPANFRSPEVARLISPLHAFNTLRLGIEGTPMVAFTQFSDREAWDLAFYVASMQHASTNNDNIKNNINNISNSSNINSTDDRSNSVDSAGSTENKFPEAFHGTPEDALKDLASLSDEEFLNKWTSLDQDKHLSTEQAQVLIKKLRLYQPSRNYIDLTRGKLQAALQFAKKAEWDRASTLAIEAYLDGVEPIEPQLRSLNTELLTDIETHMGQFRSLMKNKSAISDIEKQIIIIESDLTQIEKTLRHTQMPSSFAFLSTLGVLLREGFEATFIIIALMSVLQAAKAQTALLWLHGGWIFGIFLGALAWIFSGWAMKLSGAGRELMEGMISLFAVVILLYVGFWLHRLTEAKRWRQFLEVKVQTLLKSRKLYGLAFMSFIAVFREAIESVLFLKAIQLESGPQGDHGIALGVVVAFALLLVLAWLGLRGSRKLPIQTLFSVSAFTMLVLAVVMTGQGLHALQETGLVSSTSVAIDFLGQWRIDVLGLFPTWETWGGQLIILAASLLLWKLGRNNTSNNNDPDGGNKDSKKKSNLIAQGDLSEQERQGFRPAAPASVSAALNVK